MRGVIQIVVLVVSASAWMGAASAAAAGETVVDTVPLRWTMEGASYSGQPAGDKVDGSFQRTRARSAGTKMVVHTTGLRPGHAYTLWFTFFNRPEHCHFPPSSELDCGVVDLVSPLTDASVVFGDGAVAGADGTATFVGYRPVNEMPTGTEQIAFGTGVLTNPLGAEYQATLRGHGPHDPETYGDQQLTTLNGGCHRGEKYRCTDDQASGFRAQL